MRAELPKQQESQTSEDAGKFTGLGRNISGETYRSQKSGLSSLHLNFFI